MNRLRASAAFLTLFALACGQVVTPEPEPLPPAPGCAASETRPCGNAAVGACTRGVQRCVNGAFETACTGEVVPKTELCNSIDDDCDGEIDEGVATLWFTDADGDGYGSATQSMLACTQPIGSVATSTDCDDRPGMGTDIHPGATERCDAQNVDENCDGTVNEGCTCSTGTMQACCSGRGTQTCTQGTLSACSVMASNELCNAIDDDCDGQVDETFSITPSSPIDGGAFLADGGCGAGVGSCARDGVVRCVGGGLSCEVTVGVASTEICNSLDDDCDGVVDEVGPGLCTGPGQVCTAGQCACPVGQTTCNGVCVTLSAEICDGVDNDCNGQIDEVGTLACRADGDNDLHSDSSTTTLQCPDASRSAAGLCPINFVNPSVDQGTDCSPTNGQTFRLAVLRSDADADTACVGTATSTCIGVNPPTGFRLSTTCATEDDCNDARADLYRLASSRTDVDGDTACVNTATPDCVGAAALPGRRFTASCATEDDCADTDVRYYRRASSRTDADGDSACTDVITQDCVGVTALPGRRFTNTCNTLDDCNDSSNLVNHFEFTRGDVDNDTYCVGTSTWTCTGPSAPTGRRFSNLCAATDDCNDGDLSLYRNQTVRADSDGDQYCVGSNTTMCTGATIPNGFRLATSCLGEDCRDSNAQATTVCRLTDQYRTATRASTCPSGATTTTLTVVSSCPIGFTLAGYRPEILAGGGQCAAASPTSITQTCNFLEGTTCRVVGDCIAQ